MDGKWRKKHGFVKCVGKINRFWWWLYMRKREEEELRNYLNWSYLGIILPPNMNIYSSDNMRTHLAQWLAYFSWCWKFSWITDYINGWVTVKLGRMLIGVNACCNVSSCLGHHTEFPQGCGKESHNTLSDTLRD